jgi:hypothetical protein
MNDPASSPNIDDRYGGVAGFFLGLGIQVLVFLVLVCVALLGQNWFGAISGIFPVAFVILPLCINGFLMRRAWLRGQKRFFRGLLVATAIDFLLSSACAGLLLNFYN